MKICIDLGGTNIRIALIKGSSILTKEVYRTNIDKPQENLEQLYTFVKNIDEKIENIFICCPGPLSENNDMIIYSPNLPGWNNYPFKKEIEETLDAKVLIINDANAATLGEAARFKEYQNVLYFTISTGFGGGFSQNLSIYNGETNTAFEIKDLIVTKPKKLKYGNLCGLEDFCSGTGIYKLGLENGLNISETKDVFDLAKNGDEVAINILKYTKNTVVDVFKNMCYILNPGVIVLGGSVILHNPKYFEAIVDKFEESSDPLINNTKIKLADENGESGLLGLICLEM